MSVRGAIKYSYTVSDDRSCYKHPSVLIQLYKSVVRPHLENCSVVWNPHYTKDKVLLERVQHQFSRMFPELKKGLPYEERLSKLGLWFLEKRRDRADLIEIFKMIIVSK